MHRADGVSLPSCATPAFAFTGFFGERPSTSPMSSSKPAFFSAVSQSVFTFPLRQKFRVTPVRHPKDVVAAGKAVIARSKFIKRLNAFAEPGVRAGFDGCLGRRCQGRALRFWGANPPQIFPPIRCIIRRGRFVSDAARTAAIATGKHMQIKLTGVYVDDRTRHCGSTPRCWALEKGERDAGIVPLVEGGLGRRQVE